MNRLQEYRAAAGLTQPQVAAGLKAVEARADTPLVSRYEKGVCLPTAAQLDRLEELLGAGRLELYDLEDLSLVGPPRRAGRASGGNWFPPGTRGQEAERRTFRRKSPREEVLPGAPCLCRQLPARPSGRVRVLLLERLARRGPQTATGRVRRPEQGCESGGGPGGVMVWRFPPTWETPRTRSPPGGARYAGGSSTETRPSRASGGGCAAPSVERSRTVKIDPETARAVLEAVDDELRKYLSDDLRDRIWNQMVGRFPLPPEME